MNPLFNFLGGRKMTICIAAIVAITALSIAGRHEAAVAVEWITYVAGIGSGSIALEDGISSVKRNRADTKSITTEYTEKGYGGAGSQKSMGNMRTVSEAKNAKK